MKVAIVGGRSFRSYFLLEEVMDSIGKLWAIKNNIPVHSFKPKWDSFGRSAGKVRNCEMLDFCDKVVAFWNLFSPGTGHMIDIARKRNKLLHVEEYND